MQEKINVNFYLIIFVLYAGCSHLADAEKYQITYDYIHGKKEIGSFSIAKLEVYQLNNHGFPGSYEDVNRVTCKVINGEKKHKIYFFEENVGYSWFNSTLEDRFVANDSLNGLSISEKLNVLREEGTLENAEKNNYSTIPINLEKENWYCLSGLHDIEGYYFFYVNNDKTVDTYYFDGGPY